MSEPISIHLGSLSALDVSELTRELPGGTVSFTRTVATGTRYGELAATEAVILYSPLAVQVLGAWLLKARKRSTVVLEVTSEGTDGRTTRQSVTVDTRASDAPDAQVLAQLGQVLRPAAGPDARAEPTDPARGGRDSG